MRHGFNVLGLEHRAKARGRQLQPMRRFGGRRLPNETKLTSRALKVKSAIPTPDLGRFGPCNATGFDIVGAP